MRRLVIALVAGVAVAGGAALVPSQAEAHPIGGGWGGYYGHGRHDVVPHWHRTHTPFGPVHWYGIGAHDFRPHWHTHGPFHTRGHHFTPWGYTESFHPRHPWGGIRHGDPSIRPQSPSTRRRIRWSIEIGPGPRVRM
jgi:hypothetical protein